MTALTTSAVGISKTLEVTPEISEYSNKDRGELKRYRKQRWGQEVLENLESSFTMLQQLVGAYTPIPHP